MKKRTMKKQITLFLVGILISSMAFSQKADIEKRIKKVNKLLAKDKLDKADELLDEILYDYPVSGKLWDFSTKLKLQKWEDSKQLDGIFEGNVTVTIEGAKSKEENQKLTNDFLSIINDLTPSKLAYKDLITTLRKATLFTNDAYYSSMIMRLELVDMEVDTNISSLAMEYYREAEREFHNKNYANAAENYQKAIDDQPHFYKANLYLGDTYYFMRDYIEAINKFKQAKEKFPEMLEPRKYLVDSYSKEGLYEKCLEEAIETFTIYPDVSMSQKLRDAARLNDKELEIEWTPRGCIPNTTKESKEKVELTTENDPWYHYQMSKEKIMDYCNEDGIITKENSLTNSKYMEVFGWEEMLINNENKQLDEARKMQELGFLDCYVMVTCFHHDFYKQYHDFAMNNEQKIIEYFNTFIK